MLLSLAEPGLGFVYNTRIRAGFIIIIAYNMILFSILLFTDWWKSFSVLAAFVVCYVLFRLGALIYVGLDARRLKVIRLTVYNRVYIYALILAVVYSIGLILPDPSIQPFSKR